MVVHTLDYLNQSNVISGIRLRVALVGIIADHPAMCKLCGFADHSHNEAPCTMRHHAQNAKWTETPCSLPNLCRMVRPSLSYIMNQFELGSAELPTRSGEEHQQHCFAYNRLQTQEAKDTHFKQHGVRWTEFARLR